MKNKAKSASLLTQIFFVILIGSLSSGCSSDCRYSTWYEYDLKFTVRDVFLSENSDDGKLLTEIPITSGAEGTINVSNIQSSCDPRVVNTSDDCLSTRSSFLVEVEHAEFDTVGISFLKGNTLETLIVNTSLNVPDTIDDSNVVKTDYIILTGLSVAAKGEWMPIYYEKVGDGTELFVKEEGFQMTRTYKPYTYDGKVEYRNGLIALTATLDDFVISGPVEKETILDFCFDD